MPHEQARRPAIDEKALAAYTSVLEPFPQEVKDAMRLTEGTVERFRSVSSGGREMLESLLPSLGISAEEIVIPGVDPGTEIELTVLLPAGDAPFSAAMLWVHGGGMVAGNRYGIDGQVVEWVSRHRLVVISVEYRLAPEHPYPAAVDDVLMAFEWLVENAAQYGVDPSKLLLGGTSAGGGIAAAVSLRTRDQGRRTPHAQFLFAPMLDDRNDSNSSRALPDAPIWPRESNSVAWKAYLGDIRRDDAPAYAAPARAADFSNLPPTYIEVGSAEVFRDECIDLARSIWEYGGDAELHVWSGGFHIFNSVSPGATLSQASFRPREDWLLRVIT
ncbi:alpha/beta hydrolase [Microbacterium sp. AGC85]